MSKAAIQKIRKERADCIRKFGIELLNLKAIREKKPFEDAYAQCLSGPIPDVKGITIDKSKYFGYSLNNVLFDIKPKKKIKSLKPDGVTLTSIQMNSLVIGVCNTDEDYITDPFAHLEFNIIIKGSISQKVDVISSWHLDRHIEGGNSPEDCHPIYHLQYGGKNLKLDDGTFKYGSNFILDVPRFAHLPLDGVLGADFILSNFFGGFREDCCKNSNAYSRYIAECQQVYWRPYLFASSGHWKTFTPSGNNWPSLKILPQLV